MRRELAICDAQMRALTGRRSLLAMMQEATPATPRYLGINPAAINPIHRLPHAEAGLVVTTPSTFATITHVQRIQALPDSSRPTSLMTLGGLHRRRRTNIQSGWLVQSGEPFTAAQLADSTGRGGRAGGNGRREKVKVSSQAWFAIPSPRVPGLCGTTRPPLAATAPLFLTYTLARRCSQYAALLSQRSLCRIPQARGASAW